MTEGTFLIELIYINKRREGGGRKIKAKEDVTTKQVGLMDSGKGTQTKGFGQPLEAGKGKERILL